MIPNQSGTASLASIQANPIKIASTKVTPTKNTRLDFVCAPIVSIGKQGCDQILIKYLLAMKPIVNCAYNQPNVFILPVTRHQKMLCENMPGNNF